MEKGNEETERQKEISFRKENVKAKNKAGKRKIKKEERNEEVIEYKVNDGNDRK